MTKQMRAWSVGAPGPIAERPLVETTLPELTVEGVFDAAISTFDGLNYLTPTDFTTTLSVVADRLRPGGWLVFDLHTDAMLALAASRPVTNASAVAEFTIGAILAETRLIRAGSRGRHQLDHCEQLSGRQGSFPPGDPAAGFGRCRDHPFPAADLGVGRCDVGVPL